MIFDVIVDKIVKTETEDGIKHRVYLKCGKGPKVTLNVASPEGWVVGTLHQVKITNPQTTLEASQ